MEFAENAPIYIQISELITESILTARYGVEEKIPSVREMAVMTETNPNTVVRSYSRLQDQGIIYQKRGRGYFVAEGAVKIILKEKRTEFIERELPHFFHQMELLGITFEELRELHAEYEHGKAVEQ